MYPLQKKLFGFMTELRNEGRSCSLVCPMNGLRRKNTAMKNLAGIIKIEA
jgi:hypothetical protein